MMNPPEATHPKQKKYCITFEVTEGRTTGNIISFDHVSSSIISSLSSGALGDHSSLSESSESFPNLPVHSSTSTSSSGFNASRTGKRPAKPCHCCTVLNYLKLHCMCGHGSLLFVRDISSSKDGVEVKEGARLPEVCSDMDLTDPVISERTSSSTDIPTPAEETPDTQPFPRIRLSIRPECIVSTAIRTQEEEFEAIPDWWNVPKWEHMLAFPDELPVYSRPPMVPTHYKEDKRSQFLTLLWICRTLYAHNNGKEPPQGLTRVFYDPRSEPELPKEVLNLIDKFSDNDIIQIMKRFEEVRNIAKRTCAENWEGVAEEVPSSTVEKDSMEPTSSTHVTPDHGSMHPTTSTHDVPDKESIEPTSHTHVTPDHKSMHPTSSTHVAPDDVGSDSNTTLVYAKFQKWYYPGVMESSIEGWDNATHPITVHFYDGSPDKDLSPDMIFPLQRLPPGANFQMQLQSSVYDDVFFMSFVPSMHSSGIPSATVHILSEDSPMTSIPFSMTALSAKDVIQIRSALKSNFYPSRSRVNFTELNTGCILEYASRRTRVAATPSEQKNKPQQIPLKRKKDVAQKPSSSTETTPSSPKKVKTAVESSPVVVEPSSTEEPSFTSTEESSVAYLCTAPGCDELFDTEKELVAHRERIRKQKKRRHTTMQLISRVVSKPSSFRNPSNKKQVNFADGPSKPGGSRCVTIQPPQSSKVPISDSETGTDTGPSLCGSRWSRCIQGYGLRPEKCMLSDKVKSFKKLKGESRVRCPPQTHLFSTQHFILTNGPPDTFTKSRKRVVDSETESTDVENYYSISMEFNVLKLQEAIECGGGHIYSDFSDVPADLRNNPGHDFIVVSSHPTCTANYIYAVALGCIIVRHDTIFDCVKKNMPLRDALSSGSAMLLPPGWCEHKMTWAPLRTSQVKPLKNLMFFLALKCDQETKLFWSSLIRHLGGKPVTIEEKHQTYARLDRTIYGIVADCDVASSLANQANQRGMPIVNTVWVIQAVITGSQPPFSPYKVTVVDSSS